MTLTVTWDEHSAVVDDGKVIHASSDEAQREIESRLKEPLREMYGNPSAAADPAALVDQVRVLKPGDAGFVTAALESLPQSTVTGEE